MPVSIQVVGLPFQEEKVLGISKNIEKHFKFYEKHPLPQNPWYQHLWIYLQIWITSSFFIVLGFFGVFSLFSLFSFLGLFGGAFVLHLFELDALFDFEFDFFEEVGQDILEDGDRLGVGFIEVDPDFDPVAGRIVDFGRDKPEPIYLVASYKILSQQEKGQLLIYLFFLGFSFTDLEDEPTSFLILFVLPLGFDTLFEELYGVDFFLWVADEVAGYEGKYVFCLLFSLRK